MAEVQSLRDTQQNNREVEHLGFLAHELRDALGSVNLSLQLVDQIVVTAEIEARAKMQLLDIQIAPELEIVGDQQLVYSAVSNLIQNALKYSRHGSRIQIRAHLLGAGTVIEVEDECGGLKNDVVDLFKPFEQQNENRSGLGLGLTIAQKAIALNGGTIELQNLPGKGCVFKIHIPNKTTGS